MYLKSWFKTIKTKSISLRISKETKFYTYHIYNDSKTSYYECIHNNLTLYLTNIYIKTNINSPNVSI